MAKSLKSGILRDRFPKGESRETKLNEIAPEARAAFPYFFRLPYQNPIKLLKWRIYVRKRCITDIAFRRAVWEMARQDVAFFAVTFAVIFEPRPEPRWLPFHLWTDQVSLLAWFSEIFGVRSGAVNKTRGIGLSWLCAMFIIHKWLFVPECKIAVLTKDKDLLDSPDCNSLIGKFQYMFDALPTWAKYTPTGGSLLSRLTEKTTFINVANKAVIQGFVSTSTKLRQLRFTMIFADEFAFYERTDQEEWMVSAGGCTNCRLMVSTWNNFDDMFHRIMFEEESSLLRMNAFWWNNYERWQGAYLMKAGRPLLVDIAYKHTPDYEFGVPDLVDEGTLRSPWVDAVLSEPGVDRLKALRDLYGRAVCERTNMFFASEVQAAVRESCRDPGVAGLLDISSGKVRILPTHKSNIRTWGGVPERKRGPYVLGCDLAHGAEAAFSVAQVIDAGGEHVLEYGTNKVGITQFAYDVVLLARWLCGDEGDGYCLIDFESNGSLANPFVAELLRLQYGRIHRSELKYNANEDRANYMGTCNRDGGLRNFEVMERAILAMDTSVRSELIGGDMRLFGKDEDGHPVFPRCRKEGHGDFVHAYGVAWWRARSIVSLENRMAFDEESEYNSAVGEIQRNPFRAGGKLWSSNWQ